LYKVDLNSDLGESFGAYTMGADGEILKYVTSANIACGYHAGDPVVMEETVGLAKAAGVAVGAHPGYPDLMGFGRRNMAATPAEAKAYMKYQLGALWAIAKSKGTAIRHVKPHGALYNTAAVNRDLARALAEAVAEVDDGIIFLGLAGSRMIDEARAVGLKTASEVFADRGYTEEGNLVPRQEAGAFIHDPELAIRRVIGMVKQGKVESATGKEIEIQADSICVHGDNPQALAFVSNIRRELIASGVSIVDLSEIVS